MRTYGGRTVRAQAVAVSCALALLCTAELTHAQSGVEVRAGGHYDAGSMKRIVLGSEYRDLWTNSIEVPVLSPDTFAGGLEFLERGGGRQTRSIRFGDRHGREWVFRSVDKDQAGGLHPDLQETVVDDVIQDQISSKHPAAALVVAPLMEAVGVLHAAPRLAVMADHPVLGEYREEFAGMLGIIEERPTEVDDGEGFRFGAYERLIGTDRFMERIRESAEDRPEARNYLTARYMDLIIGDWDRHEDQWRWAQLDRDGRRYWLPIPRDRDNAFFHADGVIGAAGGFVRPFVVRFDEEFPSIYGLTYNGRPTDRLILPELEYDEWVEVAREVQSRLTDEVIADAVRRMPAPYYERSGAEIERKLRLRRDALLDVVPTFYQQLVHEAEVFGTDEDDTLEVERRADGSVVVRLSEPELGGYFERRFVPSETREVRVFLNDGDDHATVRGAASGGILVRIIGGEGDDRLEDTVGRGSALTVLYDAEGDNTFVRGARTEVDTRPYAPPVRDTLLQNNMPPTRDWGASHTMFQPSVGWASQIGPVLGVGPQWTRYGFRRAPYATRMGLELQVAPLDALFGVELDLRRRITGERGENRLTATATQISVDRFHGFGNETPEGDDPDRMLVWSNRYEATATMTRFLTPSFHVGIGPTVTHFDPEAEPGSPAALTEVAGSRAFGAGGALLTAELDTRDFEPYPRSGFRFEAAIRGFPVVWGDAPEAFVHGSATASTYLPIPFPLETTLALRAGGEHVAGDAPFQFAASLGGGSSLRGYRTDRFRGDSSLFGTAELRTALGYVDLLLVKGDIGTIALADLGRVFLAGEESNEWHSAFGGGIWFGPVDRELTAHVTFEVGQRQTLSAGLGVPF